MTFNKNYSIPKTELYPTDCLEHIKTLKLKTLSNGVPDFNDTFNSFITIGNLSKTTEGKLEFQFLDGKFQNCGSLTPNIRLRCESESETRTNITIEGLEVDSEDIIGLQCWAFGYINSLNVEDTFSQRKWSGCFKASGAACDNVKPRDLIIGMSCGGSVLLLALVGVVTATMMHRRKAVVVHTPTTDLSPSHIVINKTENTKEDIYIAADSQVIKIFFPSKMPIKGHKGKLSF